jgi:hypothetical protein
MMYTCCALVCSRRVCGTDATVWRLANIRGVHASEEATE